jgi:hypothetical protein
MHCAFLRGLSGLAGCLLFSTAALAGGHNAIDYPLRVHVFEHNGHSHYYGQTRTLDVVDGEGRANLFENGVPRGFDFSYRCEERLRNSMGFETYLAKWKKQDRVLEILLPEMGKPGAFNGCELKVEMKGSAYAKRGGTLEEVPQAALQEWMVKHEYDPEHGKNEPVKPAPAPAQAPAGTGASTAQ